MWKKGICKKIVVTMKKNVFKFCSVGKASQKTTSIKVLPSFCRCPVVSLERFSIAFTANGKRQAEISRLQKTREINLFSVYGVTAMEQVLKTENKARIKSFSCFYDKQQPAVCCLALAVNSKPNLSIMVLQAKLCNWLFGNLKIRKKKD